ncbi:MAG: hypothetical protein QW265_04365 [Candidatus Bathyarchaeia archaeon]
MKEIKSILAIVLLNSLFINLIVIPIPSNNGERVLNITLDTNQPVYSYWNKEIKITGSGFESKKLYHVWIRRMRENASTYTGLSFTASNEGLIPANAIIPIATSYKPGSYQISVSSSEKVDNQIAKCSFGLWGISKQVYQRTETVVIDGGGVWPNNGMKMLIRSPTGTYVSGLTLIANKYGEFRHEWKTSKSDVLGLYDAFIDGVGTYDDPTESFFHKAWFTLIAATLSIGIHAQPEKSYKRTQKASILYKVSYPSQEPVTDIKPKYAPLELMHDQKKITELIPSCVDSTNGIWKVDWVIPKNATLGSNYRFRLIANAFDDGFGNLGPSEELISNKFEITFGELAIKLLLNKTSYQIGFEKLEIPIRIEYNDGSLLAEGLANCTLSHGDYSVVLPLEFIKEKKIWYASFPISVLEVFHVGKWIIRINAIDKFGNLGSYEASISMEPWLLSLLVFIFLLIVLLALRLRRKYWKIIYSKVKNQFIKLSIKT